MKFRAAFAGGSDQRDREPRFEGHRDERGFAVTRDAFNADVFRVDRGIGFEIVERAGGAPGPGAERAPVVRLAGLAFVYESDDSFGKSGAVVRLDARGREIRVAPAGGEE